MARVPFLRRAGGPAGSLVVAADGEWREEAHEELLLLNLVPRGSPPVFDEQSRQGFGFGHGDYPGFVCPNRDHLVFHGIGAKARITSPVVVQSHATFRDLWFGPPEGRNSAQPLVTVDSADGTEVIVTFLGCIFERENAQAPTYVAVLLPAKVAFIACTFLGGPGGAEPVTHAGDPANVSFLGCANLTSFDFAGVGEARGSHMLSSIQSNRDAVRTSKAILDVGVTGSLPNGSVTNFGPELPDNAVIIDAWYEVITTFTSATDAATIQLGVATDTPAGIVAAIAISDASNPWDAGNRRGIPTRATPGTYTTKTTARRRLIVTVGGGQTVTAGKLHLFTDYFVSE